jgi:tRNA pseudouridine38-40 synthase
VTPTRYRAIVAYDGKAYQGFQRLPGSVPTVQGALEAALTQVCGRSAVPITGAGRTDAGVHATGQVIAFEVSGWKRDDATLLRAINATLPTDMAVLRLERAAPGFHPRFSARSRTYQYVLYEAPVRHPLLARTHWHLRRESGHGLDLAAMNVAAGRLVGIHDFASFGAPPQGVATTMREVRRSAWSEVPLPAHLNQTGRACGYTIEANAFLYHMVRSIVAALVEIGQQRMRVGDFIEGWQAAQRGRFKQLAPPHGLTLIEVTYDDSGTTPAGENLHEI